MVAVSYSTDPPSVQHWTELAGVSEHVVNIAGGYANQELDAHEQNKIYRDIGYGFPVRGNTVHLRPSAVSVLSRYGEDALDTP